MPELPEVETIRRGLAPVVEGAAITAVRLNRPDLRFPLPPGFAARLTGRTILSAGRRGKYLLFELSGGLTWLCHLGMTGAFRFETGALAEPTRLRPAAATPAHDHVLVDLAPRQGAPVRLIYTDARRFGFMDLFAEGETSRFLDGLGPEPLGNALSAAALAPRLAGRALPVKSALMDQRMIAGLGNIYVCEALHRAGIDPAAPAAALVEAGGAPAPAFEALLRALRDVLSEAIEAGGSTLRDYRNAGGGPGYFQHSFAVYGREGEPCPRPGCGGTVARIVQSGRSTFFCPRCQTRPGVNSG